MSVDEGDDKLTSEDLFGFKVGDKSKNLAGNSRRRKFAGATNSHWRFEREDLLQFGQGYKLIAQEH